jgi:hypothetical protein
VRAAPASDVRRERLEAARRRDPELLLVEPLEFR